MRVRLAMHRVPNSHCEPFFCLLAASFGKALYSSCADVVFAPLNQRAMKFVGG